MWWDRQDKTGFIQSGNTKGSSIIMAKKSFDQRLKDRWLGKQNEKASQTMARMREFDGLFNNKIFNQLRRILTHNQEGGKK